MTPSSAPASWPASAATPSKPSLPWGWPPLPWEPARGGNQLFFEDLVRAGAVSTRDRGRLYCCLRHRELMRRTGLSKNTLSRCTAELEAHCMVEKRRVHQAGGTAYNLFFLLPGAHVDKFNTLHPRTVSQPTPLPPGRHPPRSWDQL